MAGEESKKKVSDAMRGLTSELAGHVEFTGVHAGEGEETEPPHIRVRLVKEYPHHELVHKVGDVPVRYHVEPDASEGAVTHQALYEAWHKLKTQLAGDRRIGGIRRSGRDQQPLLTVLMRYGRARNVPPEINGIPVKVEHETNDVTDPGSGRAQR